MVSTKFKDESIPGVVGLDFEERSKVLKEDMKYKAVSASPGTACAV
jgi:hypothetical protein